VFTLIVGVTSFFFGSMSHRMEATTVQLRDQQLAKERAEKLASEAQLAALQARVHPHFLFNTINSVLALMREDARAAETMLERLSRLLRFSLETQQQTGIPLEEELRLVRDYLEIEKTRFGERLRFSIDAPEELLGMMVPPYALQTLVENSVKYAVSPRREGARIEVRAARYNGTLALVVKDDGPGFTREAIRGGHGLDTLERRLNALYGKESFLQVSRDGGAVVALRLPA
jgi:LytS/YehU family sensor histidine kinase